MYKRRSRLSRYKQYKLLKMFVAGVTARAASEIVGVHRNTAAKFYMRLRQLIAGSFHHMRINHSELFADQQNHINGIENFWNQAKRHLRKFNGIQPNNFYCFLKECEWRFNSGDHQQLLKQLKYWYSQTKH